MSRRAVRAVAPGLAALLVAACSTAPLATAVPTPGPDGAQAVAMVAAIRAAGAAVGDELDVQPLRDPMVEDLREQARAFEQTAQPARAAEALDRALAIVADDPALLQERAEAALLLGDVDTAAALALQAWRLGSRVGPLCRRHWETLHQLRQHAGDLPGARSAQAQRDACTSAGPARY